MECDNCGRRFDKAANLRRHANKKNPCRPPGYRCDRCGKNYASYQSLWQHKDRRCRQAATLQTEDQVETHHDSEIAEELQKAHAEANQLQAAYNDLVELQRATVRQLAECKAREGQLREEHKADTDRILELEAEYDDLAELQHKTMCKLAECKAQADQQDEDNAAILREARDCAEQAQANTENTHKEWKVALWQARADAEQARAEAEQARAEADQVRAKAQHIPNLVAEVCAAKKSLAEAQAARLVLEEEVDKMRCNSSQPRQKKKNRNGKR